MSSESDTPDASNVVSSSSGNNDVPGSSRMTASDDQAAATTASSTTDHLRKCPDSAVAGTNGSGGGGATRGSGKAAPMPVVEIPEIPIGDLKVRPKLRFEVVTARVIETAGKKHVVSQQR